MNRVTDIAIMAGGNSSEAVVSMKSAAQIEKIIDRTRYNPFTVHVTGSRWYCKSSSGVECEVDKNDFSVNVDGKRVKLEYALILIHGTPGEDGLLQAYFEMMGIPYSSCGFLVSAVTFDKYLCKKALSQSDISLAKDMLISRGDPVDTKAMVGRLGLPMFIKPNASGSSFGVSKVKSEEEIIPALEAAFREGNQVIAEEFMKGREVSCGVMIAGGKEYVFPVTEIISKKEFFDYEAKYTDGMSEEITPADLPVHIKERLNRDTLAIYKAIGCRGIVRIDFIICGDTPKMIEINTVPGMSENSIIPKQAAAMGIPITELFNIIIADTFK